MRLTIKQLRDWTIQEDAFARIEAITGPEAEVTHDLCVRLAGIVNFHLAARLLSVEAQDVFKRAAVEAYAAFNRATAEPRAAFYRATAKPRAACDRALFEAWEAYKRALAEPSAASYRAEAEAFWEALNMGDV